MVDVGGPYSGRVLGGYRLGPRLASHPHGEVYRARDEQLDRVVVVKLVPGGAASPAAQAQCLAEARVAARIDHPYATRVYGHGVESDGTCWIALEAVPGPTLAALVAARGPLGVVETVELVGRLAEVLATMHDQRLWHRDLKPDNILVTSRAGRRLPTLCDFGLAALAVDGPAGTPAYMAPEQWGTGPIDARTDVYALALCAWFALTGRDAYDGAGRGSLPTTSLPTGIDAVVRAALALDPAARPASALAFAAALRGAADDRIRPRLDEAIIETIASGAPEPVAEAMAAWEAAGSARAELVALVELATVTARWLAIVAIAIRWARGMAPTAALAGLGPDGWDAAAWLAIGREDAPAGELARAIDRVARDVVLEEASSASLDDRVGLQLAAVERLLRAAAPILACRVVVRTGARVERWNGVRRRRRPAVWIETPDALPEGVAVLVDEGGRPLVGLDGLSAIAAPSAGEPAELFVLAARDGAELLLTTVPTGYRRRAAAGGLGLTDAVAVEAASDDDGPYRGLEAFGPGDARWFVGRERAVEDCLNRLRDRRLVAIVGPSGAGKSSFVLAGVVPGAGAAHVAVTRPGAAPLAALAAALGAAADADGAAIVARARTLAVDGAVLVVVDQLEELVTRGGDAAGFGAALAALLAVPDVRAIVTVRDDFLVRVAAATGLGDAMSAGIVLLGPPALVDLHRIVSEPAARAGYRFDDPGLAVAMVTAAAEATSPLPLLSFAARALWARRDRQLKLLRRADLDALGGLVGALATHADATVDALPGDGEAQVRSLLATLATAEGTRIAASRDELVDGGASAAVIDRLIDARLLVSRDGAVELVHEALLTAWPRLARWRRDDALAAQLRDGVRSAATQWETRGRPRDLLWRGDALDELRVGRRRHALRLTRRDEAFCAASLAEAQRRVRRRRLIVGAGFVAVVAVALVLARATREAGLQRRAALAAETRAIASRQQAHAQLVDALVEQGRRAALDDRPFEALAWLDAALEAGADRAPIARLIGEAAAAIGYAVRPPVAFATPVHGAAWSPSGRRVALGGSTGDARVIVLDAAGAVVRELPDLGDTVTSVAIAPDDRRVATATRATGLRIWSLDTGAALATVGGDAVLARWSPAGRWLAVTSRGAGVQVYDGATLALARVIGPTGAPLEAAWLDDERLVVGDRDGALRVVEVSGGRTLDRRATDLAALDLVVDPTGVAVMPLDDDRAGHWSTATGAWQVFAGHQGTVDHVAVSADGAQLVTAAADGTVLAWSTATGRIERTLVGHRGGVTAVGFAGAVAVSGGADGTLRAWREGAPVVRAGHAAAITALAIGPTGTVLTGDADGRVALWPAAALAPLVGVAMPGARTLVVAGARMIAVGPGMARDLDGRELPARPAPSGADGPITSAYARGGGATATGALALPDGDRVVLLDGGQLVARCAAAAPVMRAAVSRDGAWLAAATRSGAVICARAGAGAAVATPIAGVTGSVWAVAFSPDGRALAVAGEAGAIHVVTLATDAAAVAQLADGVTGLVWLDDATLAATTRAGDVQVVDRDGTVGVTVAGAGVAANAIARVDASHVAVGFDDGDVALVSLPLAREVARWRLGGTATGIVATGAALWVVVSGRIVTVPLAPVDGVDVHRLVRCGAPFRVEGGRLTRSPRADCT